MDLSTTYLGLNLPHPVMPGASPMVDHLDLVKRLEDAGAAAITMHSLFEEQITREQLGMVYHMELLDHGSSEALSYFPQASEFRLGPYQYLEQVRLVKQTVALPVIASLNGTTSEGWLEYAKLIQQAGADALELNVYHVAADPRETGAAVERRCHCRSPSSCRRSTRRWRTWRRSSTPSASKAWCSSTASTSRISTCRTWP
jgi:dihydroorotate dehydrogenase (fumarate)